MSLLTPKSDSIFPFHILPRLIVRYYKKPLHPTIQDQEIPWRHRNASFIDIIRITSAVHFSNRWSTILHFYEIHSTQLQIYSNYTIQNMFFLGEKLVSFITSSTKCPLEHREKSQNDYDFRNLFNTKRQYGTNIAVTNKWSKKPWILPSTSLRARTGVFFLCEEGFPKQPQLISVCLQEIQNSYEIIHKRQAPRNYLQFCTPEIIPGTWVIFLIYYWL